MFVFVLVIIVVLVIALVFVLAPGAVLASHSCAAHPAHMIAHGNDSLGLLHRGQNGLHGLHVLGLGRFHGLVGLLELLLLGVAEAQLFLHHPLHARAFVAAVLFLALVMGAQPQGRR